MIEPVIRVEGDGFFTGGNSGVPGPQFEMSAAEKVVGFSGGGTVDLLLKRFESLINVAGGEKVLGRLGERKRQQWQR
jgi:hypothetical protein